MTIRPALIFSTLGASVVRFVVNRGVVVGFLPEPCPQLFGNIFGVQGGIVFQRDGNFGMTGQLLQDRRFYL